MYLFMANMEERKKIVFTIDTNLPGGGERVITTLANYMSHKNHMVTVVNSDTDSNFYLLDDNIEVRKMGLDKIALNKLSGIKRFFMKIKYLVKLFQAERPDIVVTFLFNMEAPTIIAGILTGTPVIASVRNGANSYSRGVRIFRKITYPFIKGVVFQSKAVQQHRDFAKLKNGKVIMNPMSSEILDKQIPVKFDQRNNWIINVGRLDEQKNQKLLINAFKVIHDEFPLLELHIFGAGPLERELKELLEQLELNQFVFLEGTMNDAVFKNKNARLFVMSSDYEGFPNALAEALVCGLPSISTKFDSGVAEELITDGVNGFLCKVGDTNDLIEKMRMALSLGKGIDAISEKSVDLYDVLNAETICREWEKFVLNQV